MTQVHALSLHRRPVGYRGRHSQQTDTWMNLCLTDGLCPRFVGERIIRPHIGRRVMLVQRRHIELRAMAEMLGVLGYRVTPAEESDEALFHFRKAPCEMVISELDMPYLNGFQLARCIRQLAPRTPILMMTACCQAEVVDYMDARVVDGWLFKPFGMQALRDMLESVKLFQQEVEWTI
jgi:DNA-binding NtrC family response regulator